MINWDTLIKPENSGQISGNEAECRNSESNCSCGFQDFVPTVPTVPTSFEGGRKEKENHAPGEGVASDNYCDAKTYPVNPIAVTLLLTCCNKTTVNKEETLEAIWKLQTIPQQEQIRSWAILCYKNGIDPHRIIYPFVQSPNKGTSCQGCKHLNMQSIHTVHTEGKRRVYRFVCSQHHQILEAFYVAERVLIAPESCGDYLSTA
jgi:hypothetical protein